ncbi:MAG TPA: SLC13 family permease [Candidatus Sulfotelmatobacter sp.]|nr:SLC13 family permease [Candidatus Sulfotelmatobacter sp.]
MTSAPDPGNPIPARAAPARPWLWPVVALASYALVLLLPRPGGLSLAGQAVVGVALAGMILWIAEALPLGVTAIAILILMAVSPGAKIGAAFAGFATPVVYFLVGILVIAHAVERSGLAARAARVLVRRAGGSPARLYAQLLASLPLFAFLMPSAMTRNAILIPAYQKAFRALGIGHGARAGRAVMLCLGVLHPLASSIILTGGTNSITTATLLGGFTWFRWLVLLGPPYLGLLFLGGLLLRAMVGRFEPGAEAMPAAGAAGGPAAPTASGENESGPLTGPERRVLAVLGLTTALWLTDAVHGWNPAIPALLAAALLLAPGIGVFTWREFEQTVSWGLVFTVGASLSLAQALTQTGAAAWFAGVLMGGTPYLAARPGALVVALLVMVSVVHLGITNMSACIALLIPVATTLAKSAGVNPIVCGLLVLIAVDVVILYPVQTATNLLAYEAGFYGARDVLRLGLALLALLILFTLLAILPYWRLVGLPLTM